MHETYTYGTQVTVRRALDGSFEITGVHKKSPYGCYRAQISPNLLGTALLYSFLDGEVRDGGSWELIAGPNLVLNLTPARIRGVEGRLRALHRAFEKWSGGRSGRSEW